MNYKQLSPKVQKEIRTITELPFVTSIDVSFFKHDLFFLHFCNYTWIPLDVFKPFKCFSVAGVTIQSGCNYITCEIK